MYSVQYTVYSAQCTVYRVWTGDKTVGRRWAVSSQHSSTFLVKTEVSHSRFRLLEEHKDRLRLLYQAARRVILRGAFPSGKEMEIWKERELLGLDRDRMLTRMYFD